MIKKLLKFFKTEPFYRLLPVGKMTEGELKKLRELPLETKEIIIKYSSLKVNENLNILVRGVEKDEERGNYQGAVKAHYDFVSAFKRIDKRERQENEDPMSLSVEEIKRRMKNM